jgi:hypothetical protein
MALNCKPTKSSDTLNNTQKQMTICPEDGTCTFEVLTNSAFEIKKDEYGLSYGKLVVSDKTLMRFEYIRNTPENTADGQYNELIYIEIDPDTEMLDLKDEDLKKANVTFGRVCFCPGQNGYYPVTKGQLKLNKLKDNSFELSLNFRAKDLPQVITQINKSFKLEQP